MSKVNLNWLRLLLGVKPELQAAAPPRRIIHYQAGKSRPAPKFIDLKPEDYTERATRDDICTGECKMVEPDSEDTARMERAEAEAWEEEEITQPIPRFRRHMDDDPYYYAQLPEDEELSGGEGG